MNFSEVFRGVIEQTMFDKGFEDGLKGVSNSNDTEYKKAWDIAQELRGD